MFEQDIISAVKNKGINEYRIFETKKFIQHFKFIEQKLSQTLSLLSRNLLVDNSGLCTICSSAYQQYVSKPKCIQCPFTRILFVS